MCVFMKELYLSEGYGIFFYVYNLLLYTGYCAVLVFGPYSKIGSILREFWSRCTFPLVDFSVVAVAAIHFVII